MEYFFSFLVAFLVAFFITPITAKIATKFGFVDLPNRPHPAILHKKTIPRAGGVPVFLAFLISLLLILSLSPQLELTKPLIAIIFASALLVLLGLTDDKYDLNPYLRLLANFIIVTIVIGAGIGISSFTNPFGGVVKLDSIVFQFNIAENSFLLAGEHSIIILADLVALFWIIWLMNAMNWSSGVDGQIAGTSVIALSLLGFVSASLITTDATQLLPATIAFAAAGAFLGFLPTSFYPQKMMPGYGGATLAGFLIAVLAILAGAKLASVLLVILVPLTDSLWAIVRRVLGGHSPVWGDNFHLHHQFLRMGWSVPQICLFYYLLTFIFGILALRLDSQGKFFAISILGALIFSGLFTTFILVRKLALRRDA